VEALYEGDHSRLIIFRDEAARWLATRGIDQR
jgi:hypothetical protein